MKVSLFENFLINRLFPMRLLPLITVRLALFFSRIKFEFFFTSNKGSAGHFRIFQILISLHIINKYNLCANN
ncbi:MAG: hypothetical protein B7Y25_02825 [Alphaproteobacteria bacterium 16-39-46]|nr:MAG: hypothetical protein B7Y25_02825 [Alphaproteobacteria bacterium 16-39-46]OZA43532.1 MAG: hypothetical protein B7X84_02995 [Alphaproteobacteria bacterium 17-39-52]